MTVDYLFGEGFDVVGLDFKWGKADKLLKAEDCFTA